LTHHIATGRHDRLGAAPNNFPQTLPPVDSELAREAVADPYDLDFLGSPGINVGL
jgi:predicted nuclease of restriction endonuclease-like (RecB) superfamily